MILNEYGQIAHDAWLKLPERYPNITLDVFQVMPNHFHAILALSPAPAPVRAALAAAQDIAQDIAPNNGARVNRAPTGDDNGARVNRAPTVGEIIGAYKSLVANGCLKIYKSKNEIMGKLWQRNYWEHIIRNEESFFRIAAYIVNNPINWNSDKLNPDQNNQPS
ncbi:MAG: transposase [Bacteroidales bacterium]